MIVTVKKAFADRYTYRMYSENETIELDDDRAKALADRGLVAPVGDAEEKPKKKPAPKRKKKEV